MATAATAIRPSVRYLCIQCPSGESVHRKAVDDRCAACGGEVYAFDAVECPRCLAWAHEHDAEAFRAGHACPREAGA